MMIEMMHNNLSVYQMLSQIGARHSFCGSDLYEEEELDSDLCSLDGSVQVNPFVGRECEFI